MKLKCKACTLVVDTKNLEQHIAKFCQNLGIIKDRGDIISAYKEFAKILDEPRTIDDIQAELDKVITNRKITVVTKKWPPPFKKDAAKLPTKVPVE